MPRSPADRLEPGRPLILSQVADGAEGLVLADLARALAARPKPAPTCLLVVCRDGPRMAQLARALDEQTIDRLGRQQPVASDLRLRVGALRMSASRERMADLAQHIAQLARYRYPESAIPEGLRKTFAKMGAVDVKMASLLVALLRDQDAKVIDKIRDLDDDLDELHAKVFEKVLSQKVQVDGPTGVVDATLASRYHERFGDHAVDITKQMNFFLNGELQ